MRWKLTIAYEGGSYAGWQSQPGGEAVQDVVEGALAKITGGRTVLHGAGRTDAGVHALGQCAHFDAKEGRLKAEEWQRALNAGLPASIRVMQCRGVAEDFHARFSAKGKVYRYVIRNNGVLPPLEAGRAWHVPKELDVERLKEAGRIFTGRHDFAAYAANRGTPSHSTERTIREIRVVKKGTLLTVTFEGEGFLYKMVRMLTAAMVRAAQNRIPARELEARLRDGKPKWNHVAPAEGLYLVKVLY